MILFLRRPNPIPLDLDGLLPERINNLTIDGLQRFPVLHGNRREELGQFFDIQENDSPTLTLVGDLTNVHNIGRGMTDEMIHINGSVGRHCGALLNGGMISVTQKAGDWLGAEMRSGTIHVGGDAGNCVGGAYRGSRLGMRGGSISIQGNAGDEVALLMRRGQIYVGGKCGAFAGASMIAGTLISMEGVGPCCGAGMKRGTILIGGEEPGLPSGFAYSCEYEPTWLQYYGNQVLELPTKTVRCYRGDILTGGRGEILVLTKG